MTEAMDDLLRRLATGSGATSTRDRQLVAIADALLRHDVDVADALLRDHLSDYPDSPDAIRLSGFLQHAAHTQHDPHTSHTRKDPS